MLISITEWSNLLFLVTESFTKAGIQISNMSIASNYKGDIWYITRTDKTIPSDLSIQGVTVY